MFESEKEKSKELGLKKEQIANSEVSNFINSFRVEMLELINALEFLKAPKEVIPPWIICIHPKHETIEQECPNHKMAVTYWPEDWYWYGGEGGTYWGKYFVPYFDGLSIGERKEYFYKYDLGHKWKERELWLLDIFDHEIFAGVTEAESDSAFSELSK